MKISLTAFVALSLVGGLFIAGCQSEPKPLTPEDKAAMMDRSDVPQGYLDAHKARMGGGGGAGAPGPVMPPADAGGGQPTGQ